MTTIGRLGLVVPGTATVVAALIVPGCKVESSPSSGETAAVPAASVSRSADLSGSRSEVAFQSGPLKLTGFLWLPKGGGPHRAVVFNHGSEANPDDGRRLARFYNAHGFVFFVPVRRGHGRSEGKYVIAMQDEASQTSRQRLVVDELVAQVDDVLAAHAYLASRSDVRKDAIALTGCSFGGIETVLTAERSTDYRVAVDFAGGAMSWKANALLRDRMKQAVARATIPILFVQAENDFSIEPSIELSAEMDRAKKANHKIIYPPRGDSPQSGHGLCRVADVWGPDVLAWIDRTMP